MPNYPVAPSSQPLSSSNSYALWPGGGIPRPPLVGGGKTRKNHRKPSRKSSKKTPRRGHRKH